MEYYAKLNGCEETTMKAVEEFGKNRILKRILHHDHRVWKEDPAEISNRLGWLACPHAMESAIDDLERFAASVAGEGFTDVALIGMGGSSLAPEVLVRLLGSRPDRLRLRILDSTDPGAVSAAERSLDCSRTLFVVATKSGTTVETRSLFNYFYNRVAAAVGQEKAARSFVAITDPGASLVNTAANLGFRRTYLNDPEIGGRFSALSYFGLLPGALIGADIGGLLEGARRRLALCRTSTDGTELPEVRLGVALATLALSGRNKLTFILPTSLESFGAWVEQLIAESTGKEGKGILPVVGESPARPEDYDDDRIFVALGKDDRTMSFLEKLAAEGHPVFRMGLNGAGDLGEQFFLWEMATAAAGHVLAINPFDQPNVESAKIQTKEAVALFKKTGRLPGDEPLCSEGSLTFYGNVIGAEPKEIIGALLKKATAGSYVALQAYLNPADSIDDALSVLRNGLRDRLRKAVTLGYGPRFLHSTGQLHKGDGGKGLFIQITADDREDRPIPDEPGSQASSLSFGVLKAAQAMGDCRALVAGGRTVVRVHISGDTEEGLEALGKIVLSV